MLTPRVSDLPVPNRKRTLGPGSLFNSNRKIRASQLTKHALYAVIRSGYLDLATFHLEDILRTESNTDLATLAPLSLYPDDRRLL